MSSIVCNRALTSFTSRVSRCSNTSVTWVKAGLGVSRRNYPNDRRRAGHLRSLSSINRQHDVIRSTHERTASVQTTHEWIYGYCMYYVTKLQMVISIKQLLRPFDSHHLTLCMAQLSRKNIADYHKYMTTELARLSQVRSRAYARAHSSSTCRSNETDFYLWQLTSYSMYLRSLTISSINFACQLNVSYFQQDTSYPYNDRKPQNDESITAVRLIESSKE